MRFLRKQVVAHELSIMRRRILVLPAAALLILAMMAYKLTRRYPDRPISPQAALQTAAAPMFQLTDENNHPVRLKSYVGRHRIVLVFYDGELGADRDPTLLQLRGEFERIDSAGIVVFGISTALPQQNRRAIERGGAFPFLLLSDIPTGAQSVPFQVHHTWGRIDENTFRTHSGVFLIDRKGDVDWSNGKPVPVASTEELWKELFGDE